MSKVICIGGVVILVIIFAFYFFSNKQPAPEPSLPKDSSYMEATVNTATPTTNIKASFAIFTNGTFRIFTASMYHNLSQDSYIEASNPNIVRVKKTGTTWNDFFSTLPFKLTSECLTTGTKETFCNGNRGTLKFYINGEQSNNALTQEIKDGDKLLVTFGTESNQQVKHQIQRVPTP